MRKVTKLVSPAALAIALVAIGAAAAGAEQINCGPFSATGLVTVPGTETTASNTFAPIATYNMTTFSANCVHIQFTAQIRSKTPRSVQLRATVDGMPAGFPNFVTVNTSASAYDERTVTFIIPNQANSAEIGIEIRSGTEGTAVNIRNGILQVQHNNTDGAPAPPSSF